MYTQCPHCQAIFRINMREITVAKGKIRCGECQKIFDASDNLSTNMPEPYVAEEHTPNTRSNRNSNKVATKQKENIVKKTVSSKPFHEQIKDEDYLVSNDPSITASNQPEESRNIPLVMDNWDLIPVEEELNNLTPTNHQTTNNPEHENSPQLSKTEGKPKRRKTIKYNKWLIITAVSLLLLLIAQILYSKLDLFSSNEVHEPEKIEMLNHNVFVHPNEEGVLLISASMKNTAAFTQAYPYLEVSLTNAQSTIVALRRFKPEEYIENYNEKMLLPSNTAVNFKLKIKDPGSSATRFQFDFL